MSRERVELIEERLRAALTVEGLEVIDDSHLHRGHAGARAGGGHYRVRIISPDFEGRGTIARHRMVYAAMGDAMRNDVIHALSIQALTPAEAVG
ncbi:BolA family protein [Arhodomonas sp. SL1]|uniref:BolA family protein n=1 Tax=Arhodomonas sp. SL1 TaxID=3425691 RepID=UPI003F885956